MAWDYENNTGSFDGSFDLSALTNGADIESPLRDVSNSAQDMQPWTNTGNGTGVFLDTQTQNALFSGLDKVLNYALLRDQQTMARTPTTMQVGAYQQQQQQFQQQAGNSRLILWVALGLGAFMIVSRA
jgi:hypothetical protein